jgi:hypothetical protein
MSKRPNPRLVKIHRSYEVADIAKLFGIHRNTVRTWIKQGLPVCDNRRPQLITGSALRDFLQAKRTKHKSPCQPGELYCLRLSPASETSRRYGGFCTNHPQGGQVHGYLSGVRMLDAQAHRHG